MPTYQYKCKECGHMFEVFQSMSAEPIKICPKCKGAVKRLIGPGAALFSKVQDFIKQIIKIKRLLLPLKKLPRTLLH